jgi:hypothetical protein
MSSHFNLLHELVLNNYNIFLYTLDTTTDYIHIEDLNNLSAELNTKQYTKDIIELLRPLKGIAKVAIFDKNNNLLTSSGLLIIQE